MCKGGGNGKAEFLVRRKNARAKKAANRKTNGRPAPAIARSGGGGADLQSLASLSGGGIPAVRSFFTPV